MKRTALYEVHRRAGARMVAFAGWEMPIQYHSILEEVRAVRSRWGLFDVSHMGRARFHGENTLPFLHWLTPSDLSKVGDYSALYTVLTNEQGGVVDDIILYRLASDHWLMVFNAANHDKDLAWFLRWQSHFSPPPAIVDETERTVMIAVQGPQAVAHLTELLTPNLADVPRFGALAFEWQGIPVFAGRTGYTGEDGFELIVPAEAGERLWERLLEAGATPCGLGARDVLRVEAGLHLYGHELTDETNPIEAGLGWLVSDRTDYLGAEIIQRVKAEGPTRKLMGIILQERGVPREGYSVLIEGQVAGHLTSGVYSPTLEHGIGMAYLPSEWAKPGTPCAVEIRGKPVPALVTTRRFLKKS
ncbi:MAG: glycine cleavage system aminomethyltransferase GcvT [Fimbriimonadales bacterium]|nr:glycine cleavage system aminomethyltransferase GcvT [Fimbriimonadales bacterium]